MLRTTAFTIPFVMACTFLSLRTGTNNKAGEAAQAQSEFSGAETIMVDYSHAHMGGRRIFGGVVPYGKTWRTNVNGASTFITDDDLVRKGEEYPRWQLHLSHCHQP